MKQLFCHICLLILACCFFFTANSGGLFVPIDGIYREQLIKFYIEWTNPSLISPLNPLQALGSLAFPSNFWLSPAALLNYISYRISGVIISPVLFYTCISVELFLCTFYLARCMDISRAVASTASWIAVIFLMPFFQPPQNGGFFSFYMITAIVPDIAENISIICVILGLIIRLQANCRYKIARTLAISFLTAYEMAHLPLTTALFFPLVASFALYWLVWQSLGVKEIHETIRLCLLLFVPLVLPLIFVAGFLAYSIPSLFPLDFRSDREEWAHISVLFHGPTNISWAGTIIYIAGFSGAILSLFNESVALKKTAIFYLIYSGTLTIAGCIFAFVLTQYRTPSFIYLEWYLWPLMFIFTTFLFGKLLLWMGQYIRRFIPLKVTAFAHSSRKIIEERAKAFSLNWVQSFAVGAFIGLCLCTFSFSLHKSNPLNSGPYAFPPPPTPLTKALMDRIGLQSGHHWKGCMATLVDTPLGGTDTSWPQQSSWDYTIWKTTGNEYHHIIPWWYNIPTLFTYTSTISPDYYLLVTRFLSLQNDVQVKSLPVLTQLNVKILKMLGVRVVVSNKPLNSESLQLISESPSGVYAYDLKNPYISGFSPGSVTLCTSLEETFRVMTDPAYDPFNNTVVYEPVPANLTRAENPTLYWSKKGVKVKATAPGKSLLVIPLQYTNCIRVKVNNQPKVAPRLIRTNVALMGILFDEDLDITIESSYGPLSNVFGRFKDYWELKRLGCQNYTQFLRGKPDILPPPGGPM
ncbi:hypothetical protein DB346_04505 [Verrucomicrobia bacterium LW23]|nr:hypothetical protein DB346_04505 [Verrucomicrobia bacterium LW23]